jgi:hypothetical protein
MVVEVFSTTTKEQLRLNVMNLSRVMDTQGGVGTGTPKTSEICRVCGLMSDEEHFHGVSSRARAIFNYAFGVFFQDIATWLILGLVVAAFIQVAVPGTGFQQSWVGRHSSVQVLLAIIGGIPLYSCATATTPLAAVLISKGLNPGAALALLLAGPATNISSIFAFRREFGLRVTTVYYTALLGFCWILGVGFNVVWPVIARYPSLTAVSHSTTLSWLVTGIPGWLEVACAWILVVLSLRVWGSAIRSRLAGEQGHLHDHDHDHAAIVDTKGDRCD